MHARIKTTGDLRLLLGEAINMVLDGQLDLDKATRLAKLAAQINESFYAEVQASKIRLTDGEKPPTLGDMELGGSMKLLENGE